MQGAPQFARGLDVPVEADSVDSPIVTYRAHASAVEFLTNDVRWARITFEKLDSLKVSRGEYDPFPPDPSVPEGLHWVTTVFNSVWLSERYKYERRYYGRDYNFGGDVAEMLDEYSHYVFHFHDQFVEALATGIWFEVDANRIGDRELDAAHPFRGLSHIAPTESFESFGIKCCVRRNPRPLEHLERAAQLCSQTLLDVGAKLDGEFHPSWFLTRRIKDGVGKTYLRNNFGHAVQVFEGIPDLLAIRPRIDRWLFEVRRRRRQMGLD